MKNKLCQKFLILINCKNLISTHSELLTELKELVVNENLFRCPKLFCAIIYVPLYQVYLIKLKLNNI